MEQKIKKGMKNLGALIYSDDIIGLNRYEVVLIVNGFIIIMAADLVPNTSWKVLLTQIQHHGFPDTADSFCSGLTVSSSVQDPSTPNTREEEFHAENSCEKNGRKCDEKQRTIMIILKEVTLK